MNLFSFGFSEPIADCGFEKIEGSQSVFTAYRLLYSLIRIPQSAAL